MRPKMHRLAYNNKNKIIYIIPKKRVKEEYRDSINLI